MGDEIKPDKFVILHTELMKLVKKPLEIDTTSDLRESERNTMLKLIQGMAIDAYGYDPESTRNTATGDKNGISAVKQRSISTITIETARSMKNQVEPGINPRLQ